MPREKFFGTQWGALSLSSNFDLRIRKSHGIQIQDAHKGGREDTFIYKKLSSLRKIQPGEKFSPKRSRTRVT